MIKMKVLLLVSILLLPAGLLAQEKPIIVLNVFDMAPDVVLPYDMELLQRSVLAELKARFAKDFVDVVTAAPSTTTTGKVYTVGGLFTSWQPGSTAKRILVGFGSGRESADFHYWISDETGKKVVDRKEKIKAQFIGSSYQGNVGELSHPVADKLGDRISGAKIIQKQKK